MLVADEGWTSFIRRAGEIKAIIPKLAFFPLAPFPREEYAATDIAVETR